MAPEIHLGSRIAPRLFALFLMIAPSLAGAQVRDWAGPFDSGTSDMVGCVRCLWGNFSPPPLSLFSTRAVAADAAGSSWVVGSSFNGTDHDLRIVKYDAQGVEQWAALYDSGGDDTAVSVGVDSAGNAYVGGSAYLMTTFYWDVQPHALVVKLGPDGGFVWRRIHRPSVYALGVSLVVKPSGHSYLAIKSFSDYLYDVYTEVIETLPDGSAGWSETPWFGFDTESSYPINLFLDANNNLYLTGWLHNPTDQQDYRDYYVIKWGAPSGFARLWTSGGQDHAYDVTVDEAGRIFVIGDRGITAFSATGDTLWAQPFAGTAHAVAAADGGVYVSGGNGQDIVTTRYDAATGGPLWTQASGGDGAETGMALRLAGPNVWVAGTSSNGANDDMLLVGLDAATGTEVWQDRIDLGGGESVVAMTGVGSRLWLAGNADGDFLTARYTVPLAAGLTLAKLTLSPANFPGGCRTSTGWVTLSAPAPAGGALVTLADTNPAATVPASVTVPAGQTRVSFPVTAPLVDTRQTGEVTALYGGSSRSAALTVRPLAVASLVLGSNPVTGPGQVDGSVLLECAAGPGGVTVNLSSSNPAVAWTSAASIVIPAGATTGRFTVSVTDVAMTQFVDIRANTPSGGKVVRLQVN